MSELRHVDIRDIQPGPIVHNELSKSLIDRIRPVYYTLKPHLDKTLEEFETGFMRDIDPEREVVIWESIAEAFNLVINETKKPPTTEDRKKYFATLLLLTMGKVTDFEIQTSAKVEMCWRAYKQAREKRGPLQP